ncbi:hypothetical protein V7128_24670 [Neobacillus vireti]|uniref:hypothetical protein n=1 Tax=Neobacillus vireti TaxID=220686 RepID=UPI002FFD81AF
MFDNTSLFVGLLIVGIFTFTVFLIGEFIKEFEQVNSEDEHVPTITKNNSVYKSETLISDE